jgi:hypothetical protein
MHGLTRKSYTAAGSEYAALESRGAQPNVEASGTGQDHQHPTPLTGESTSRCVELTVDPHRLVRNVFLVCLAAILAFFLLDCFVNYRMWIDLPSIRRLFNTTREDGMASWFGVTQTFMVALTLWLIFVTARQQTGSRWRQAGWLVLALFFTYMAIDDGSALHERLGSALEDMQESGSGDSWAAALLDVFPSYAWQVCLLPFFGALGLFTLFFLWRELNDTPSRVLVAAAVGCMALAVGLDFVEGLDPDHSWNVYTGFSERFGWEGLTTEAYDTPYEVLRHFSKSLEESLEMLAMTLLWVVFLRHWIRSAGDLRVRFVRREPG